MESDFAARYLSAYPSFLAGLSIYFAALAGATVWMLRFKVWKPFTPQSVTMLAVLMLAIGVVLLKVSQEAGKLHEVLGVLPRELARKWALMLAAASGAFLLLGFGALVAYGICLVRQVRSEQATKP